MLSKMKGIPGFRANARGERFSSSVIVEAPSGGVIDQGFQDCTPKVVPLESFHNKANVVPWGPFKGSQTQGYNRRDTSPKPLNSEK